MTDSKLRRLQLTQLEILKVFDKICMDHGLRYSLYAGSLLGAVRHQGFIPWDDDLDVCMARADYDRFMEIWEAVKPEGYILQNKENTPGFTQSFSKIRKDINYAPNKKTVLAFTIALELSLDEAKDLLRSAGFALSRSSKTDIIVAYFLQNKIYDMFEINDVLYAYGQPVFG